MCFTSGKRYFVNKNRFLKKFISERSQIYKKINYVIVPKQSESSVLSPSSNSGQITTRCMNVRIEAKQNKPEPTMFNDVIHRVSCPDIGQRSTTGGSQWEPARRGGSGAGVVSADCLHDMHRMTSQGRE